jgi:hypothetical protein
MSAADVYRYGPQHGVAHQHAASCAAARDVREQCLVSSETEGLLVSGIDLRRTRTGVGTASK